MSPELLLTLVQARSSPLDGLSSGGRPEWSILECAWGLGGLQDGPLDAFLWRYARDGRALLTLLPALLREGYRLARVEHWPKRIDGQPYLPALAEVVVHEEHMSDLQRDRLLRRMQAAWGEQVWKKHLERRHRALGAVLDRWCMTGHEHIARRIREYEE